VAERLYANPDTPTQPGQHQQQAEADEAHADDLCRSPDAGGESDGDRYGTDEQEPCADGDDDERTAVVGGDERHCERRCSGRRHRPLSGTAGVTVDGLHQRSKRTHYQQNITLSRR